MSIKTTIAIVLQNLPLFIEVSDPYKTGTKACDILDRLGYNIKLDSIKDQKRTCVSCLIFFTSLFKMAISLSNDEQNLSIFESLSANDLSIAFLTPVIDGFSVYKRTEMKKMNLLTVLI